ncbi:MAG: DUF1441 family protein [Enterobacter sp.]|jgi:hypothetical protein|nr:DUF1441 family protein [Enterobacter sp.]
MDQEIASLKLNINQLAAITNVHRQTVAGRLKNVAPASGSNSKLKLFLVTDVLSELMIPTVATNLEDMSPSDRLAHWKAENERIKFEQDSGGIQNNAIALITSTLAQVSLRTTLSVQYGDNKAGIQRVDNVMADASKAVAESLRTLDSSTGGNTANVTDLSKTLADFTQASAKACR